MITIQIKKCSLENCSTEAVAFFVEQGNFDSEAIQLLEETRAHGLSAALTHQKFSGKSLQIGTTVGTNRASILDIIFVGLGPKNKQGVIDHELYRRAVGKAIRTAEMRKDSSLTLVLPIAPLMGWSDEQLSEQSALAAQMAIYRFTDYITDQERFSPALTAIDFLIENHNEQEVRKGIARAAIIADAVNTTRHWIDLPPLVMTPKKLADYASSIAHEHGLKVTRFNEKDVIVMGMGGLAGVSAGSDQECQLVILEYHTASANAPTIAFVGKGITFDSGGLSLKPAANMEAMKDDMSGAAAVINVMKAIAQLKPAINVIGVTPISENLPSGKATKPGDILTFYNGKTAEVKNTDAEGRLILADALSYAVKQYTLDAIIDVATLTGACAYALGPFFTGMMSQHEELAQRVQRSADRTGDRVWPLPFHDDYKTAIRSEVADICNIGSPKYMAGAVTAGFFLQHFVGTVPWVHLDIAGTAFDVPDITYYRPASATGASVRLLIDLALSWNTPVEKK